MSMIHEVGVDLGVQLAARGVPFPVVDGPELRPTTTSARERIVIELDADTDESFGPIHKVGTNPRAKTTRIQTAKITIYAQHPAKGALYWEHQRRAEGVLDRVLCCLEVVAKTRQNVWTPKSGRFVYPEDLKASETFGGAVYVLKFIFDRAVQDTHWGGAGIPTTTIAPVMMGGPQVTFSGQTIIRSFGNFQVDGFQVGQTITVAGSTSNNGTFTLTGVAAGALTVSATLTNEGPEYGVSIVGPGAALQSTLTVVDPAGDTEST